MSRSRKLAKAAARKSKAAQKAAAQAQSPQQAQVTQVVRDLPAKLRDMLTQHHNVYVAAAKAEQLEELVSGALANAGAANDWRPGSHTVSTDITLTQSGATISVKSGEVKGGGTTLTISGSRLGKSSSSLASMLGQVKASSAEYYLCLARDKADWPADVDARSDKKYLLFIFPAALLDYGTAADWTVRETDSGKKVYACSPSKGAIASASISESMSFQLWTDITVSKLPRVIPIIVPGRK